MISRNKSSPHKIRLSLSEKKRNKRKDRSKRGKKLNRLKK